MSTLALALLVLAPRADVRLTGRVLDSTGKPAANVHVVAGEVGHASVFYTTPKEMMVATPGIAAPESARWAFDVRTDAEGKFAVSGLAYGVFGLVAASEAAIVLAQVKLGDDSAPLELRLEPLAELDVELRALPFDPTKHLGELRCTKTFDNVQLLPRLEPVAGAWSFHTRVLPPGCDWRFVGSELVIAQDYRATLFDLPLRAPSGTASYALDRVYAAGVDLRGRVVGPAGEPLANVSVVARDETLPAREFGAISDANGAFRIRGTAPGTWEVAARRWTIRELAGCGNGRQDLEARATVVLSLTDDAPLELKLGAFLGVPKVGELAPDFRVKTLAGTELTLAALRGKVVLLDFWATWCGICRMEFPRLTQTYAELAAGGKFEIVGVSVDAEPALVPRFVASRDLRWPQTALGPAATNPIARLFNVNSTPATVLIDRDGKIAALDLVGAPLRAKIEELLAAQ